MNRVAKLKKYGSDTTNEEYFFTCACVCVCALRLPPTGLPQTRGNQGNQGKATLFLENSGNFNFSQGNQGKIFTAFRKNSH